MALRVVSSAGDWHHSQVHISKHPPCFSHWMINLQRRCDKFDKSWIYPTALWEICIISTHLWDCVHGQVGSPHWLSSFYCVRWWAIQPSENGIIYSLSTSGMLAPLSLTTAWQFTLVPLTPLSVTAVFKYKSIYKYITDKKMASELLIFCSWRGTF